MGRVFGLSTSVNWLGRRLARAPVTSLARSRCQGRQVTLTPRKSSPQTLCGRRLFTANDRELTGMARFSPELRHCQTCCRTM